LNQNWICSSCDLSFVATNQDSVVATIKSQFQLRKKTPLVLRHFYRGGDEAPLCRHSL